MKAFTAEDAEDAEVTDVKPFEAVLKNAPSPLTGEGRGEGEQRLEFLRKNISKIRLDFVLPTGDIALNANKHAGFQRFYGVNAIVEIKNADLFSAVQSGGEQWGGQITR